MSQSQFSLGICIASLVIASATGVVQSGDPPAKKDPITPIMREILARVNKIHDRMKRSDIDAAIDALHQEIKREDPAVFVPLALPHLLRLAPNDPRTRIVLRQALAKGWIEEQLARAFLIQAGDDPSPHIKRLLKDLDSKDGRVRARAMTALGACGDAAEAALLKLRRMANKADADPSDFVRDYALDQDVPEPVRARWAVSSIEAGLAEHKKK